jgi:hypothetical protein
VQFCPILTISKRISEENAPCGYLSLRTDGRIAKANQTFCRWTGYGPGQAACADSSTKQGALHAETSTSSAAHFH